MKKPPYRLSASCCRRPSPGAYAAGPKTHREIVTNWFEELKERMGD